MEPRPDTIAWGGRRSREAGQQCLKVPRLDGKRTPRCDIQGGANGSLLARLTNLRSSRGTESSCNDSRVFVSRGASWACVEGVSFQTTREDCQPPHHSSEGERDTERHHGRPLWSVGDESEQWWQALGRHSGRASAQTAGIKAQRHARAGRT